MNKEEKELNATVKTFRINIDLLRKLQIYADEEERTLSNAIIVLIKRGLSEHYRKMKTLK